MDERGNCPSASGIGRLQLCPGSWAFESKFPRVESAEANEGTIRHELIADEDIDPSTLESERRFVVSRARALLDNARVDSGMDLEPKTTQEKEQRYWLLNEAGTRVMSGMFDYAEYSDKTGLVADYKTLSGYQINAYDNLQLRAYAVLLAEKHGLDCVYISLIQPLGIEAYSIDMLGKKDLRECRKELLDILKEAISPHAQRRPHPNACKWCKGLAHCPEVRDVMDTITGVDVETLEDPVEVERLLAVAQIASKWASRLTAWAKEKMKEDEDWLPNYKLRGSGKVKTVSDSRKAVALLRKELKFSEDDLLKFSRVSIPEMVKLYEKLTGETKGSRKKVEEIIASVIVAKDKSPTLFKNKH